MAETLKYTLEDFNNIIFNGFNLVLPDEIIQHISKLAQEVGSPDYVKTPVFKKRDNPMKVDVTKNLNFKKKKGNNVIDNEWDNKKLFQPTKLEEKIGLDVQIDAIRSYLNKMSDKNYTDMKNKIINVIDNDVFESTNDSDMLRVSTVIFEIASTNRFFSEIYAALYSELIGKYEIMRLVFESNFNKYMDLFDKIEYIDSTIDYDRFCINNKDNERRRALSSFFVNLMLNKIITDDKIIEITRNLLCQLYQFINEDNKKNEVDELTENISILYRKDLYKKKRVYELIDNMTIPDIISKLAHSKIKDYKSMTNKAIFKFMDLIEM